jgi:hypothetical protein
MGQRANYIIRSGEEITIYYHHWRAHTLAADLYLGEARFLEFVQSCSVKDNLMDEVWIEGLVLVDVSAKHLYYWGLELLGDSSVDKYYQKMLAERWQGWKITVLRNVMYEIEAILNINYTSTQAFVRPKVLTKEMILTSNAVVWPATLVIIKRLDGHTDVKASSLYLDEIVCHGPEIISLMQMVESMPLFREKEWENRPWQYIICDLVQQRIVINESIIGLWENSAAQWPGFSMLMGSYGYIAILEMAGINTSTLKMTQEEIEVSFNEMIAQNETFDTASLAQLLSGDVGEEAQFHPDFFDDVRPKKTLFEKIKLGLRKMFTK